MLKMPLREEKEFKSGGSSMNYPAAPEPSNSMSFGSKTDSHETVIGENVRIEGTVHANENMVIEGYLKGTVDIKSNQFTIGLKGQVEADIEADSVVISGKMTGNVNARNKVHATKEANFNGQIKARRVAIEDGAYVKASIELEQDDTSKKSSKTDTPKSTSL